MRTKRQVDQEILRIAARQESVVHARDLRAVGITTSMVSRRVLDKFMSPVIDRTYVVGPACAHPSFRMRCMAGTQAAGVGSHVDGETALHLLGAWDERVGTEVHVVSPGRALRNRPGRFVFHRAAPGWIPAASIVDGAIPVVGFFDACVRGSRQLTKWQLAFVIQRGIYLRLIDLEEIIQLTLQRSGQPGDCVLRDAVQLVVDHSAGTRSRSEDAILRDVLVDPGVEEPLVNVRGALGLSRDEPDLTWPARRVNVEIDGGHHDDPAQAADDRRRDAEAAALGWRVLRVRTRTYWGNRHATIRRILAFLHDQ